MLFFLAYEETREKEKGKKAPLWGEQLLTRHSCSTMRSAATLKKDAEDKQRRRDLNLVYRQQLLEQGHDHRDRQLRDREAQEAEVQRIQAADAAMQAKIASEMSKLTTGTRRGGSARSNNIFS